MGRDGGRKCPIRPPSRPSVLPSQRGPEISAHAASQRRRAGSQAYLLDKYEELGTLHQAFWALVSLHKHEPDAYHEVMGTNRLLRYETFHGYWSDIPLARRRAARRRHLSRSQAVA